MYGNDAIYNSLVNACIRILHRSTVPYSVPKLWRSRALHTGLVHGTWYHNNITITLVFLQTVSALTLPKCPANETSFQLSILQTEVYAGVEL